MPVPPYAEPDRAGPASSVEAVGYRAAPYVPAVWRDVLGIAAVEARLAPTSVTQPPGTPEAGSATRTPVRVPPYHPLRPTPLGASAVRSPLYIPAFPTPGHESAVEDEGVIEPQLVTTAEYAVPAAGVATPVAVSPVEATPASSTPPTVTPAGGVATAEEELPWIEAFLASTPATPLPAVTPDVAVDAVNVDDGVDREITIGRTPMYLTPLATPVVEDRAGGAAGDVVEAPADEGVESAPSDEWPLEEAATEFRALSLRPEGQEGPWKQSYMPAPLPAWSDDDLMDIMPVAHTGKTPLTTAATQPSEAQLWSDRAQKAQEEAQVIRAMASAQAAVQVASASPAPEATAEEAAHALELLARRVRAGELTLPSYDPRMGEPAALVAALAALLGVRLR